MITIINHCWMSVISRIIKASICVITTRLKENNIVLVFSFQVLARTSSLLLIYFHSRYLLKTLNAIFVARLAPSASRHLIVFAHSVHLSRQILPQLYFVLRTNKLTFAVIAIYTPKNRRHICTQKSMICRCDVKIAGYQELFIGQQTIKTDIV